MTDPNQAPARPSDVSMVHELKTWPAYFSAVLDGSKTFEVRKADRDFRVGDTLHLREFIPPSGAPDDGGDYTGRELRVEVTYLLVGAPAFGFAEYMGYVVMGIRRAPDPRPAAGESWRGQWEHEARGGEGA